MGDELQDEAAIRGLMDRYGSGVDERNWADFEQIFDDPTDVIVKVLGHKPSPDLLARLQERRGLRSMTEQPSIEQREQAARRSWGDEVMRS